MFNKINILAVLAFLAFSQPTWAKAGGDAGGYNGPNLAPGSIPLQLDRGIRAYQVTAAMDVCLATGDAKAGIVSVMQRLVQQVSGSTTGPALRGNDGNNYDSAYDGQSTFDGQRFVASGTLDVPQFRESNSGTILSWNVKSTNLVVLYPALTKQDGAELMVPELPEIHFQSVAAGTGYDEFGNVDNNSAILVGVTLKMPANYGASIPLVNFETKHPSALTVNLVEYADCLKGELQKNAR